MNTFPYSSQAIISKSPLEYDILSKNLLTESYFIKCRVLFHNLLAKKTFLAEITKNLKNALKRPNNAFFQPQRIKEYFIKNQNFL